jgi:hypothetical protein
VERGRLAVRYILSVEFISKINIFQHWYFLSNNLRIVSDDMLGMRKDLWNDPKIDEN